MNLPNKLTLARCIMTPVFLALLLIRFPYHYAAALVVFIVASLTDLADGKIARSRGLVCRCNLLFYRGRSIDFRLFGFSEKASEP